MKPGFKLLKMLMMTPESKMSSETTMNTTPLILIYGTEIA